jgi:2-(1,2-epoxy-1,2-dihydrophenyl)acetyl-CoA isomerase
MAERPGDSSDASGAAAGNGLRYAVGDDGIATLTLDRPDKRNAVMPADWRGLEDALDEGAADPNVRAFVVTGAGDAFCAGGDLKTMGERLEHSSVRRSRELLRMTRAIQRFRETPKPILAAVNGPAIGAGCVIALACDVRLATASAVFSVPFLRVGMQPDFGGAYFLPRLLGTARTFELLWTGDSLTAEEAQRIGLVNRVYPDAEFAASVADFARKVAKNPAGALAMSKLTVYHGAEQTLRDLLDIEALAQTVLSKSEDAREGVRAFVEKRKPAFRGE